MILKITSLTESSSKKHITHALCFNHVMCPQITDNLPFYCGFEIKFLIFACFLRCLACNKCFHTIKLNYVYCQTPKSIIKKCLYNLFCHNVKIQFIIPNKKCNAIYKNTIYFLS